MQPFSNGVFTMVSFKTKYFFQFDKKRLQAAAKLYLIW